MKPRKIERLEALARECVGDGRQPDLFFVTDQGVVVTVTRDLTVAHTHWRELARRFPLVESALENRQYGVLASVAPEEDDSPKLHVHDDVQGFLALKRTTTTTNNRANGAEKE